MPKIKRLVGSFNPSEKYALQIGNHFPNFRGDNKKYLSCHQTELVGGFNPVENY